MFKESVNFFLLILLLAFVTYLYLGGVTDFKMLDDGENLSVIAEHADDLAMLKLEVFGNNSGPLGRPVSMFSFAADAWLNGEFSYARAKQVNLAIHCVIALVLFGFLEMMKSRLNFSSRDCFFVVAFWLVSPLWVSTVLYAVQRMAQLSTLFMLLSLYVFCRARITFEGDSRWSYKVIGLFFLSITFLLLGLYSKENAVVVIPVFICFEAFIFKTISIKFLLRYKKHLIYLMLLGGFILFFSSVGAKILQGYEGRDFTLIERVLTQPRMLVLAIKQVFIPSMSFGLYYDDIIVSKGLLQPWQTLVAILVVCLALAFIGYAFVTEKFSIVAFGLAWFFIGHSLESSVIALEMYFEHRSYFPAMGLLIAGLSLITAFLRQFEIQNIKYHILSVWLCFQLLSLGILVSIWSASYSFAFNSHNHHPHSVRATTLVSSLIAVVGSGEEAENFYNEYIMDDSISNNVHRVTFYCVAGEAWSEELKERFSSSLKELWDEVKSDKTGAPFEAFVEAYVSNGRCAESDVVWLADQLLALDKVEQGNLKPYINRKLMEIEIYLGRYENVLYYLDEWNIDEAQSSDILLMKYYYMSLIPAEFLTDKLAEDKQQILDILKRNKLDARQKKNLEVLSSGG